MNERKFSILDKGYIEVNRVDGCEQDIVNAARVSHDSEGTEASDKNLLKFLLKNNHNTPFRYAGYIFTVKLPIFVARQWMRHTLGSEFVEKSARYTEMTEYYVPDYLSEDEIGFMDNIMLESFAESARMVLPVSTYTKFTWKVNIQALMHFLTLRLDTHAQREIREYAKVLYAIAYTDFPTILGGYDGKTF